MNWLNWFFDHLQEIGMILGALDLVLGSLPDKVIKWPGIVLTAAHRLHQYGKDQKSILK